MDYKLITSELRVGILNNSIQENGSFKRHATCNACTASPYIQYINGLISLVLVDSLKADVYLAKISADGYGHGSTIENSTGIVKCILEKKADISNPDLDMTYDRSLVLSFGPVLMFSTRVLVVNREFVRHIYQLAYWRTFRMNCLLFWTALLSFLWLLDVWWPQSRRRNSRRCVEFVLMSSFLIFNAIFNGRLINTRSLAVSSLPFTTLHNSAAAIRSQNYRMVWPIGNENAVQQEILKEPRFAKLRAELEKKPPVRAADANIVGKYIAENPTYFSYNDDTFGAAVVSRRKGELLMMKDSGSMLVMQSFGYDRKNVRLGAKVVKASLSVIESGLVKTLKRRTIASGVAQYYIEKTGIVSVASTNDIPILLSDLSNLFIATGVAMIATTIVLVVELHTDTPQI